MNKFRFTVNNDDTYVNIPLEIDFDNFGREDLIKQYENDVLEEIINPVEDFETTRYSHHQWLNGNGEPKSSTTYDFSFFNRSIDVSSTTPANTNLWVSSYNYIDPSVNNTYSGITFTNKEMYYYANSFKRSFFKLDFYDSKESENQRLYFTIVIPTQQGVIQQVDIGTVSVPKPVIIRTPTFNLDFIGDKEGYFVYWLKSREYIDVNTFYMSAKFFNAKLGQFVRMVNRPQSEMSEKFKFNKSEYFYYKVDLDVSGNTFGVYTGMTQILSGGTNGSSLLTGLTVPIVFRQTYENYGFYTPFDGFALQQDVVSNFITSGDPTNQNIIRLFNTSDEFKGFLKLSDYIVNWGDGNSEPLTSNAPQYLSHTYPNVTTSYTITLTPNNWSHSHKPLW